VGANKPPITLPLEMREKEDENQFKSLWVSFAKFNLI